MRFLLYLITFPIWILPVIIWSGWSFWDDMKEEDIFTREP